MKKIFVLFLLLPTLLLTHAQQRFYKSIAEVNPQYEAKVVATTDGGWITGGTSGFGGIRLIKYDPCGKRQWSKFYRGDINCLDLVACIRGGYALTGYYGVDVYHADPFLMKLDAAGNIQFCKQYQASSAEHTYSLGEDADGNFFINGNTSGGGTGPYHNFILKTDSLGTIRWSKLYGRGGMWALALVCSDKGVLRCGGWGNLYKVDSAGALEWAKYGYWGARYEPEEVPDGYVFGNSYLGTSLVKIDRKGNFMWNTVQLNIPNTFQRIASMPTGDLVMIGYSSVIRFNRKGKYLSHNHYEKEMGNSPHLTDICLLKDHSIVLAGLGEGMFNGRMDAQLHGCGQKELSLDTLAPASFNIRDTLYVPLDKVFNPVDISIWATDFVPVEELFCAEYDLVDCITAAVPSYETQAISVYPNPSQGKFSLKGISERYGHIKLFNSLGEAVPFRETGNEIDLGSQPAGIYVLELFEGQSRIVRKIIVKE